MKSKSNFANMKTFIALTLIGILNYAYANKIVPIKECKTVTPMNGFDAKKFFTGKWYTTHVKNVSSTTVCLTFETSISSDGKFVNDFKYTINGKENKIHCVDNGVENDKKMEFKCQKNGVDDFLSDFVILGTDYDDYTVFYRCVTLIKPNIKADNFLVLRRDAKKTELPENAKSLTNNLNLQKCSDINKA
uniref:Pc43, similar to lipocalin-like TiLipo37 n=1 Tax=Panstrongylus chinai TaxID=156444 RepID=A0A286T338_9HEMI|nr:Pc43, similar to lipocalin-like TiLipo37 [Panstrongylus chinai]